MNALVAAAIVYEVDVAPVGEPVAAATAVPSA